MTRERRKLAAIVALDVVGYSRLMERDERGTLATLTEHRTERLEPTLARHGGRLIKLIGDGALVEFGSVVDALNAAIEFQRSMTSANLDRRDDERIVFRIGVHVGDVIVDGDDLYGDGMNVAARLEGHAPPGGILISGNAKDAVVNRVSAEFCDLGRLPLKNIERPVQAFQVMFDHEERQGADAERLKTGIVPSSDAASDLSSIAVRPFTVLSDDRELQFLADGLAEDVIALLARVPGLLRDCQGIVIRISKSGYTDIRDRTAARRSLRTRGQCASTWRADLARSPTGGNGERSRALVRPI